MNFFKSRKTIFLNTSLTLAFGLICFTIISMLLVFHFIISPMANRAADDLGGLMHIISKSWVSLPADKKQDFQEHLRKQHYLFITDKDIEITDLDINYPFIPRLEKSLFHHTGQDIKIKRSIDDKDCFWAYIPQAKQIVKIGFQHRRMGPHPSIAFAGIISAGCFLILITTFILVRRITKPIKTLSDAVNSLGSGKLSTRLPESGSEELVLLAQNFNQMANEISLLLKNRSILFGGISHDLRTPITRMRLAIELIESKENQSLLSGMKKDLDEMEILIQQALEFVKGIDKSHAVNIDLTEVMNNISSNYQRQGKVIHIKNNNCGICKIEFNALQRVLCNLLDNAFRYSDNQAVNMVLNIKKQQLIIEILDQGQGIPEAELEAVFQPFYRLDNSRSKETGGSGLGLAIVHQLCTIHHWQIKLLARKTKGLKVELIIPILPSS